MTLLHESVEAKKFDVRVAERNIQRGLITEEELKKAIDQLPDDAENAEWVSIDSLIDEEGTNN